MGLGVTMVSSFPIVPTLAEVLAFRNPGLHPHRGPPWHATGKCKSLLQHQEQACWEAAGKTWLLQGSPAKWDG